MVEQGCNCVTMRRKDVNPKRKNANKAEKDKNRMVY